MVVLLIEDEIKTAHTLKKGLSEHNIESDIALDGLTGRDLAFKNKYDVIITDIVMPGINGMEFCRDLRQFGIKTPVLMLSALDTTEDKINGLEAGGDDYLTKPFEFRELLARVKALERRHSNVQKSEKIIRVADLVVDLLQKKVTRSDKLIELTPKEFKLLEYLIKNPGRTVTKPEIAENVWDIDFDTGTNVVEVYMNYLRNKIDKSFEKKLIHTKFGLGYYLSE
ncbi:MAG: response regulator transcription factor [Saprospiraceae bacterium]|nr:response regulator transcription factor [Saprospiraceae bacterium]